MTDALTRAAIEAHQEWLGYLQPVGLVVSPPALVERRRHPRPQRPPAPGRASPSCSDGDEQRRAVDPAAAVRRRSSAGRPTTSSASRDRRARDARACPSSTRRLEPTFAVARPATAARSSWLLLVRARRHRPRRRAAGDASTAGSAARRPASSGCCARPSVPIGLLVNGTHLRLVYAPGRDLRPPHLPRRRHDRGRGPADLRRPATCCWARPPVPRCRASERLPALLASSRKYQNTVSTKLAEQVLAALYELLRGFQAADARDPERAARATSLASDPDQVYGGLLTVLMRLVFVLYAEDRGLMPAATRSTSSTTRSTRPVRAAPRRRRPLPATRWTSATAPGRSCWPSSGWSTTAAATAASASRRATATCSTPTLPVPRGPRRRRRAAERPPCRMVPDGVVFRVLENLLVLDGERLSYRTLDVEQIGSVYEAMMGFRLEVAAGRVDRAASQGQDDGAAGHDRPRRAARATPPDKRAKWLTDRADAKLTDREAKALEGGARRVDELARGARAARSTAHATPDIVPAGALVLQPTDERRRSGSHYTPRSLTEPIVRTTLRPILERLGADADARADPRPEGAATRRWARARSWSRRAASSPRRWSRPGTRTAPRPTLPPDEDALLHARRLVAQRCLYGVDKNPMAVDLGQAVALARDAGQGPPVHLPRPRLRARRLAGRPDRASRSRRSTGSPSRHAASHLSATLIERRGSAKAER